MSYGLTTEQKLSAVLHALFHSNLSKNAVNMKINPSTVSSNVAVFNATTVTELADQLPSCGSFLYRQQKHANRCVWKERAELQSAP